MKPIFYTLGAFLISLTLFDVYRTVLAIGMGRGPIESKLSHWVWIVLRALGRLAPSRTWTASLCGPLVVALLLVAWSATLIFGFAFIYWPQLSSGIQSSTHSQTESFHYAFYYSGYTLTTLGLGDLYPANAFMHTLTVVQSWLGFTLLTLTISYILSVYQAVRHQNALAVKLHALSHGTGDASVLFSNLLKSKAPNSLFCEMQSGFAEMYSFHHQYPIIHYFQRLEEKYSTTRMFYLALETVSLGLALRKDLAGSETRSCWVTLENSIREFAEMIVGDSKSENSLEPLEDSESDEWSSPLLEDSSHALEFDQESYFETRGVWVPRLRRICLYLDEEWPEGKGQEKRP